MKVSLTIILAALPTSNSKYNCTFFCLRGASQSKQSPREPSCLDADSQSSDHEQRYLERECVGARSTYLGCFRNKNRNRALPFEVFGPYSRDHSGEECEAACAEAGYDVWGREFKGQCFCGDLGMYSMHGMTSGCDCCSKNVGENKFCAYSLDQSVPGCVGSGTVSSNYVGCYSDKNLARALPIQIDGKGWTVMECEAACSAEGYGYFAREFKGQCFCGTGGYNVYGITTGCDCCGENVGENKMCVWSRGST